MEMNLSRAKSFLSEKKGLSSEKKYNWRWQGRFLPSLFLLSILLLTGISKSYSQCPTTGNITVSSDVDWSAIPGLSTCSNQLITNGGTYTGNVNINVSGSGNTINVNRSITINGNLNLTSTANNNVFQIASGTTLTIVGDLGDSDNNNLQFTVLGGGTLIVTGTVYGKNNNLVGGSGVLSAGAIVTSGNINCAPGGCPVLSITDCSAGGTVCSTNNTGSSICSASYGGSVVSDQSTCSATLVPAQLTNTGYTGSILRWERSTDGGNTWDGISNVTSTYTPPSLTSSTKYRTVVLNTTGTVCNSYSSVATLTVGGPAAAGTITGQATVCKSSTGISYTVPLINGATSYIWAYSGTGATINGTGNSVTIDFSSTATAGNLTVKGNNGCGNGAVSANYAIAMSTGTVPTLNIPANVNVCNASTAALVTLTGTNISSTSWTNSNTNIGLAASGSDASTPFTVPSFTATNTGTNPITGTVTVTPKNGTCPGAPVSYTYTVRPSSTPAITSQPSTATQSICQNAAATALSVTATGTGVTYQWYSNASNSNSGGTLITGANNPTYTPPTNSIGTTYYYVVVTGCPNSVTSNVSGAVTVKPYPNSPTITGTTSYTSGNAFSLAVTTTTGATYLWSVPGTATGLSSLTAATITKASVQTTEAGNYSATVTLNGCALTSAVTPVTVVQAPSISTTGTLTSVSTTYGTASATRTFNVSGQNITQSNGITINAPSGFELSTSSTFASNMGISINVGAPGTIASTPIYIRLASTTPVGSYSGNVTLTSTGATSVNVATVASTVTAKALTLTGAVASNKVYDGNTAAAITGTLNGIVNSDVVTLVGTGTFSSKTVGTNKTVTSTSTLSGANAGNYTLTQPTGLTANITALGLTITGLTGANKPYDGTTTATTTGTAALSGVISPDVVTLGGTPVRNFANKNVGTGKAITITGYTLSGADAGNYTLTQPTGLTGNITALGLTITGLTGANKPYDGTTTATTTGTAALSGVISPDVVILGGTPVRNFANKNVGTGKAITITGYTLSGADAGNYTLTQPTGLTANITALGLTITGLTGANKPYDGTTTATTTGTAALSGVISPDVVTLGGTPVRNFANKNVGTGKAITITGYTLSGADAGNYTLTQPTGLTGNITAIGLTITGLTGANKPYDGTTTATTTGTAALSGVISPDVVALGGTPVRNFADKNVGTGKAITITGYTLSGADAGNYTLTQPTGLTGNITAIGLTITGLTGANKPYDGTTTATTTGTAALSGVISPDVVALGGTPVRNFVDKNVGIGKAIIITGYTLSGADAGNYTLTQPTGLTGNITSIPLTITAASTSKCFGATVNFVGTEFSSSGLISPDAISTVNLSSPGSNATATTAGSPYAITASVAVGTGLGNYTITYNDGSLTIISTSAWNGATSTDWNTASNWSCGIVPNSGLDVTISTGQPLFPVLGANATGSVRNLTLASGTTLGLSSGSTLNVYGNWTNAGTFSPSTGTVDFKGSSLQTIDKSGSSTLEQFYNLTLSGGNTLTVSPTTSVDILPSGTVSLASGVLDLSGRPFTLKSSAPFASGIHTVDATARLGRVIGSFQNASNFAIERYIPTPIVINGRSYVKPRYVCSPVQALAASQWAETVSIFGGSGPNAFRVLTGWNPTISTLQSYYEPSTNGSVNKGFRYVLDKTTIMNVGQGYLLNVGYDGNATYSLYGTAVDHVVLKSKGVPTTGNFSAPLTKSGADPYGWNLVGNPYAGEIDWDLVWNDNQTTVSSTVSQMDPGVLSSTTGQYYYYNARTHNTIDPRYSIDSSTTRLNKSYIASSQGFFVFARNQGSSSLLFKEAHKPAVASSVIGNYRVGDAIASVNIGVSNGTLHDNTFVYFDKNANTLGYDADLDAFKSSNTSLGISTNSYGKELAMNGISSENGVDVPVTITASQKGSYRLLVKLQESDLVGSRLYLKDSYTGALTELAEGIQTFSFDVATTNATVRRFSIVSGASHGVTTGMEGSYSANSEINIYPNPVVGDKLTIQLPKGNGASRRVEMTDLNGTLVYKMEVQATSASYVVQGLPELLSAGVYTLRVVGEEGVKQQKFVYLK